MTLFHVSHKNTLSLYWMSPNDDADQLIGWWLTGWICGRHVSVVIPWAKAA